MSEYAPDGWMTENGVAILQEGEEATVRPVKGLYGTPPARRIPVYVGPEVSEEIERLHAGADVAAASLGVALGRLDRAEAQRDAAYAYIDASPCDPDIYPAQWTAYQTMMKNRPHTHRAGRDDIDTCRVCEFNIRNPIHRTTP